MDKREQAAAADRRLQQLRQHLRRHPSDGHAWLELARHLAAGSPGPELHHAIEQAIRSLPEEDAPWRLAALLHMRRSGAPAALRWLESTASDNPGLEAPRRVLAALRGDALRSKGHWRRALEQYRLAAATRPDDPVLLNNMGGCLASLGEHADAEHCLMRALELLPGFAEAHLNLGLLRAFQLRDAEALEEIEAALAPGELPATIRHAARTLQALLIEQQRLAPAIAGAVGEDRIGALQHALEHAPDDLNKAHSETVARLRALAERCLDLDPDEPMAHLLPFDIRTQLLEAFAQCKLPGGPEALAGLWADLRQPATAGADARALHRALQVVRARRLCQVSDLTGNEGEAWLRYWHARLVGMEPAARPGQYKLTGNLVSGLSTVPPEHAAGTLRALIRELAPTLPAGWIRGLFFYCAINIVHGFGDGNGRLARFLLAWSTEAAGTGTALIPLEFRGAAARALIELWGNLDPRPHRSLLRAAGEQCARDFERLESLGVGVQDHPLLADSPLV